MKCLLRFKLFAGILATQFNANAALPQQFEFRVNSDITNNPMVSNLFSSACERLIELNHRMELTEEEYSEGELLDVLVGKACESPNEYDMASIAHKIQEF